MALKPSSRMLVGALSWGAGRRSCLEPAEGGGEYATCTTRGQGSVSPLSSLPGRISSLEGEEWRWWKDGLRLNNLVSSRFLLIISICLILGRSVHFVKWRKDPCFGVIVNLQ